ncbi:MAG TPA: helix-turn-helix domain-containing protein, partial [Burkholderiaceae bacterium]|nr:helix-turn-helix domain-containing protein [Burkholderiaceae bacterium]
LLSALPMLERGERVTDVALACGYDSMSSFIAAFRQQMGATPGDFFTSSRDGFSLRAPSDE